jgi:hypothetical protein
MSNAESRRTGRPGAHFDILQSNDFALFGGLTAW